jgi:hypothetical protein
MVERIQQAPTSRRLTDAEATALRTIANENRPYGNRLTLPAADQAARVLVACGYAKVFRHREYSGEQGLADYSTKETYEITDIGSIALKQYEELKNALLAGTAKGR